MSDAAERKKRFDSLLALAAKTHNLPQDATRVLVSAGRRIVYEEWISNFLDSGKIDPAFVRLGDGMVENEPPPPIPDTRVEVEIVERKGQPNEVRYGYGQKPPSDADGAAVPSSDNPPTTEAVEPLPDNIARLPDGRASWTQVVSRGFDPNKPRPFMRPSPEAIERQAIGKNHSRDIHAEAVRTWPGLVRGYPTSDFDARSRSEQARTEPRDPYVGAVGGTGRRNPFSHDILETNPNHAMPPTVPQPVPPKESA